MPASANFRACQVSVKKPRASPNTCGSMRITPLIGVAMNFIAATAVLSRMSPLTALAHDADEIFAVTALRERLGELKQLIRADETLSPSNLLHARDLETLPLLDDAHECSGIEQRIVRAGIEPGCSSSQYLDVQ